MQGRVPSSVLEWVMSKLAENVLGSSEGSGASSSTSISGANGSGSKKGKKAADKKEEAEDATTTQLLLRRAVENALPQLLEKILKSEHARPTISLILQCGSKGEVGADMAEMMLEKAGDSIHPDRDDGSMKAEREAEEKRKGGKGKGAEEEKSPKNETDVEEFLTPLYIAAREGWDDFLHVLLAAGANPNWQSKVM